MSLRLKSLKISNVGRFVGSHTIDLTIKSNLIQVDGLNENTGGSSGSGKSTIFNSLDYLLGINNIPSTVLQSRLSDEPMEVEGIFQDGDDEYSIVRGKGLGLSIKKNGIDIVSGNNAMAEEKLDEILNVPRELLGRMIHKKQKEGGFFLGLTPKQTHAFLVDVLDLKKWTDKIDDLEKREKEISTRIQLLSVNESSTIQAKESFEKTLSDLVEPKLDWDPSILQILEMNFKRFQSEYLQVSGDLEKELLKIEKIETPKLEWNQQIAKISLEIEQLIAQEKAEEKIKFNNLNSLSLKIKSLQDEITADLKSSESINKLELKIKDLKAKALEIKSKKCPTCKQDWHNGEQELNLIILKIKENMSEIERLNSVLSGVEAKNSALADLKAKFHNIQSEKESPIKSQINTLVLKKATLEAEDKRLMELKMQAYQQNLDMLKKKESDIRSKYSEKLETIKFNADESFKILHIKKSEYDTYLASKNNYESTKTSIFNKLEQYNNALLLILKEKTALEKEKLLITNACNLIKSYTMNLFQDMLANISLKATEMLSKIPNMSTATLYFDSLKETKSGTLKEEINAVFTIDGEIGVPVKSMSGGERTAIDLAVDLAVIQVIEERVGKGLDIFILDEPFDGLDSICREQSLELLKANVTNKKVIVVDHSNETKEMISDRILVIRSGQVSRIDVTVD